VTFPPEIFTCLEKIGFSKNTLSTLRLLKDWQRDATGEERLNGSVLLNIHREIDITAEEVINL